MSKNLAEVIDQALQDLKAHDITVLDVVELSNIMDTLVIATGTSSRHLKSLANKVVVDCKNAGFQPIGVEGMDSGDWTLVDFGDTVVHVMLQSAREFYDLEKLWTTQPATRKPQA